MSAKTSLRPRQRLELFVSLATDALRHPAASRIDLPALGTSARLALTKQGRLASWEVDLLDEWSLKAAAGDLRKFLVATDDHVHLDRVLKSLRSCLTREQQREHISTVVAAWKQFYKLHYFSAGGGKATDEESTIDLIKDRKIAVAWLYGHYLHSDPVHRAHVQYIPSETKEHAALLFVKDGFLILHALRSTVLFLDDQGLLREQRQ